MKLKKNLAVVCGIPSYNDIIFLEGFFKNFKLFAMANGRNIRKLLIKKLLKQEGVCFVMSG